MAVGNDGAAAAPSDPCAWTIVGPDIAFSSTGSARIIPGAKAAADVGYLPPDDHYRRRPPAS
jgi:hypothetical protein